MKWDTKQYESHSGLDVDALSTPIEPFDGAVPSDMCFSRLILRTGKGYSINARCALCRGPFIGKYVWYAPGRSICEACATRLQINISRGYTHRCRECSLFRCNAENSVCEECAGYMQGTG